MQALSIRYKFTLTDGSAEVFDLEIDAETMELVAPPRGEPPPWAALEFRQCPNCPLSRDEHPLCPVAERLVGIVPRFEPLISYDRVRVDVETEDRTVSSDTTVQQALSSLMGLVMATSGCPHTAFFKPMARFHLPLANEEETTFRSVSTYLIAQLFMGRQGAGLDGLKRVYEALSVVNAAMARRLRAAGQTDSSLNAVVLLDLFTIIVPAAVEDSLGEIRRLLEPFIRGIEAIEGPGKPR